MDSPATQRNIERNSAEMLIIALLGMLVLLVAIPLFHDVHAGSSDISTNNSLEDTDINSP
jgi:Co/Zn/Cd efflux system component